MDELEKERTLRRAQVYAELNRVAKEEFNALWKHSHAAARSKAARTYPDLLKQYFLTIPDEKNENPE
jgi:hypothetical protein